MNRSLCRVMMGVGGLVVLGMTATMAGAQTDAVKEKPLLYRYESYWTFPPAHWGDIDKDNFTSNQKALAPALADGTIVEYEIDREEVFSYSGDSAGQVIMAYLTPTADGWTKVSKAFTAAYKKIPLSLTVITLAKSGAFPNEDATLTETVRVDAVYR